MDRSAALEEIRRFDAGAPLERARTPPSSWYTEPAILELEAERIFRRTWQPVARVDEVARPGHYASGSLLGEPWLIVRGKDGVLRGFSNVCAHHATVLVRGAGVCEQLVCPYHGWTYALDGRLTRAPGVGGIRELDRRSLGLAPLTVAEWGGIVFLCWDPKTPALKPRILGLEQDLWTSPSGELRFVAQREYTLRCNWKVVVDNYLDGGYHVATLHAGLAGSLDLASYTTEVLESAVVQRVRADAALDDARIGAGAFYGWAHPAWMLNRYGPILDLNRVQPLDVRTTRVIFDFYVAPDRADDAGFVCASIEASDRIQQEDTAICERVQEGLASRAFDQGRYAPRFEAGAHRFHCLLARQLRPAG